MAPKRCAFLGWGGNGLRSWIEGRTRRPATVLWAGRRGGGCLQMGGGQVLLQRIPVFGRRAATAADAQRRRIGAAAFRKRLVGNARAEEQRRQAIIPFVAARLRVDSVLGVVLQGEFRDRGPR